MKWAFQLRTAEELPTAPHWGGFLPLHSQGHLGGDREGQRPFLCQMWCALCPPVFLQPCSFSPSHAFVHSTNTYGEPTSGQAPGGPRKTVVAKTETIPCFTWLTVLGLLTNKGPKTLTQYHQTLMKGLPWLDGQPFSSAPMSLWC